MILELLIVVLSAIANSVLGLFTYVKNKKSYTNRMFAVFSFSLTTYIIANYFALHQATDQLTLLWIRIVMFNAVLINYFFLLLALTFPRTKMSVSKRVLFISSFFTLFVAPLTLTSFIFKNVVPGTTQPIPGIAMPLFLLHTISFLGGGIIFLVQRYRKSKGLERTQLRLLLYGVIIMFLAIVITNLLLVILLSTTSFVGLLPIYTAVFAGTIAYAIVKHELFNVRLIAAQALTIIIWIVLFSKLFAVQTQGELLVDFVIFIAVVIFGVLLIRSVRNEVRQREKLQELTDKLKALDKQKDEFINMAAHELRAPMTAIKGYISMIMEGDAGEISDKARGYLTDVNSVNDRLVRLVNNMLNVSRIEEGRLVYKTEVIPLSTIAQTVYKSFKFEAERKGLSISLNIEEGINDTVEVDPDRLNEIIGNFTSNAVKYTEEGSIEINVTQPAAGKVRLAVKDTGPGISKSEQKKLFQKFYRVQSTAGKTIGTGLGLYISKLLVEKFHGQMGLNSDAGKGSEFWFVLPVVEKTLTETDDKK